MGSEYRDRWAALQASRNAQTAGNWDLFSEHRQKVTELLRSSAAGSAGSLCVLGAGNCNDLELGPLTEDFGELHLVDLDAEALRGGVERQCQQSNGKIRIYPGIDLSGISRLVADQGARIETVTARAASARIDGLPPACDVVASLCLLTQLLELANQYDGPRDADQLRLIQALRGRHLRLLAEQVKPGGQAVLVTDMVSSETCRALSDPPPHRVSELARSQIEQGNFFTGVNPSVLYTTLSEDPVLSAPFCGVEMIDPWIWNLGPRSYLVYAIRLARR